MKRIVEGIGTALVLLLAASAPAGAQGAKPLKKCAPDAVISGTVCMDTYEASVWRVPNATTSNRALVVKIQQGKATEAMLLAGGATHLGIEFADDHAPCADHGQNCADDVFAASIPGVRPSANITWFQAQIACENSRKRLPTNAEWQAAVMGTPDPGGDDGATDCNTYSTGISVRTGSRTNCRSTRGAYDMVGNLEEWVADWVPYSTACGAWNGIVSPTGDEQCLAGAGTGTQPGAILRGGNFFGAASAGPLAIRASSGPSSASYIMGFRCAR